MRLRPLIIWVGLFLLLLAGAWLFWSSGQRAAARKHEAAVRQAALAPSSTSMRPGSTAPQLFATGKTATNSTAASARTNQFAWRLNNTSKTISQLMNDPHGILLENAFIDTTAKLNLAIPPNLKASGDPGAYIVQSRGPVDNAFRAQLAAAGAEIVSYVPNNAYLVTMSAGGAASLADKPVKVLPYEPYYKLPASLMPYAGKSFPADRQLRVAAYPNTADAVRTWLESSGPNGPQILAERPSPFGTTFIVQNVTDLAALVQQRIIQRAEPVFRRVAANDLARVTLGISADTVTPTNYLNLSGKNVLVEVNDTGIDANHPDFSLTGTAEAPGSAPPSRVTGFPFSLVDTNGHGTHVAGIIAGNGSESLLVTSANPPQGSVMNADFRGKAPLSSLYSFAALNNGGGLDTSDYYLQSVPATNNALISNNSWNYDGDSSYNLAAASYDAAVRDALPFVTGSQPVLFVFSAGNDGGGNNDGSDGDPDTILSPATAKDVITVGALEQSRSITNTYTPPGTTNEVTPWMAGTDNSTQVAGYSARGNVGIGSEGDFGRFKPDVVAPGSFVVSTRSAQWDQAAYYNPTNHYFEVFADQFVSADSQNNYNLSLNFIPPNIIFNSNIVAVSIQILPNASSPTPFPNLPIYVSNINHPNPAVPGSYDFIETNQVFIPIPDGGSSYLAQIQNGNLFYAIVNTNSERIAFDLVEEITVTNQNGNLLTVLSNLNNTLGPEYRYESGTSMAAPAVSGTLALIQDYFTNTLHSTPSPALLKAMLINGARPVGNYSYAITNGLNYEGWGLINLPNSVSTGLTNQLNQPCSTFFLDQSPTNALATGDSQTFMVTVDPDSFGQAFPLEVTLTWTDPPGNPTAAIKLVNNLDLVITNLDTGDVYFGNDIAPNTINNVPWDTNGAPNLDSINNVENIIIPPLLDGNYSVTIVGRSVNVNAVTAQTNNVVQDFALVISSGAGEVTNAITVTPVAVASNPTSDQQITTVLINANGMATNSSNGGGLFLNQLTGANTPLLGTNMVGAGAGYVTNAEITLGMSNQWHFYVVQNNTIFSNAAFVTFLSQTLAIPRMGGFADPNQNPTQPDADVDLYVATGPGASALTNLDPVVISNCVHGVGDNRVSLGNSTGTEFVAYSNAVAGQYYYIGVKSETQEAADYGFLPVFSQQPFSQQNADGTVSVTGLFLPVNIPDGTPKHPGVNFIFALAVQPVEVQNVIVTNQIVHQNIGDLTGALSHNGKAVILNNHESLDNPPGPYNFIYDEGPAPIFGSQPADGPGSLQIFQGQQGIGPWILTEVDNTFTQTGAVTGFSLLLTPHKDLNNPGVTVSLDAGGFYYNYIDVPAGTTNLTITATNITPLPDVLFPGQLFEKFGVQPTPTLTTPTNYDKMMVITNSGPIPPLNPWGLISIGPSDVPPIQPGRYFVTLWNPSTLPQTFFVSAKLELGQAATVNFSPNGPTNLLDDAVMYSSVFVTNTLPIATVAVGLRVEHPRISDLVFHLISPDGTRYLLMENRGGTSTNGCGATIYSTNIINASAAGGSVANTNFIYVGAGSGTLTVNYNFYQVPDRMTVYASTNPADFYLASPTFRFDSGSVSNSGQFNISFPTTSSGYLTIIMNQFGSAAPTTQWTYSAGGVQTNFYYLVLTQDTNLTTTPIKFAPPPFVPVGYFTTNFALSDFESATAGDYPAPATVTGTAWRVITNQVSVVNDPTNAYQGSKFLALANGTISNNIPTVPGGIYTLNYAYRGPGIVSWWRGENNAFDSTGGNNGVLSSGGTYGLGEVGSTFILNGSGGYVKVPASSNLNVGLGTGFTIETWINPSNLNPQAIAEWNDNAGTIGAHFYVSESVGGAGPVGCLYANLYNGINHIISTGGGIVTSNSYQHVALTYNKTTGVAVIYRNGVAVQTSPLGTFLPRTGYDFYLGTRISGFATFQDFTGAIDEPSLYQRVLSPSEIKAIYANGTNGKFNPFQFTASPAQSLAEASVTIPGVAADIFFGDNTNWQQQTISFTATSTSTPVIVTGLEPGMLLDSFSVSGSGGGGNLYYLPEQSLDPLVGTSPYGTWQLEIQDDRVGATNHAILYSWQMQFVFANTNPVPAFIGVGVTNFIPPGGLAWFEVDVPTNADFATNILTFATGPLNMWYSTNMPPTITTPPGDVQLLSNVTNGTATLGTNGYPNIVPGGTYFIGIQNPGAVTAQYGIRVDFRLILPTLPKPFAFTQPATLITGTSAHLNGMATPNGAPATAWFEWGTNTLYGNQTAPTSVGAGSSVVYVSASILSLTTNVPYHFRLVVSNAQSVVYGFDQVLDEAYIVAWGADYVGQANVPPGLSNNAVAIAGAYDHSLALKQDGTAIGWGDNTFGQATVPASLSNLVAVAGGEYYSLVLKDDDTVVSWGANILGQTNVPAGLNSVVSIAGGQYCSLALKYDGTVVAWGASFFGLTNVPASLSNAVAIAGGSYHNLALKNDGTVIAWGDNSAGQTNVPPGLTNVVGIAAGSYHSVALRSDGTVVSWGDDSAYQTNVPVGLSNVVAVAAGGFNSMALKADSTVVTWGDNTAGQSSVPVGLTNVVAIASGYLHSLALTPQSIASLTNIVLDLADGVPQTNSISPGGVTYYKVSVPANADFATNNLIETINGTLNVWFTTNLPPTVGNTNDALLLAGVTNGIAVLNTNTAPLLVPGATYYLGVQNLNVSPVLYAIEVNFHLVTSTNPPPSTNIISGFTITHTNGGFLLTWFAPSNDLFQVQWSDGLGLPWNTFSNIISFNPAFYTNGPVTQFNFFDDGSQTGGFGPTRFYRLIQLGSSLNTPPVLPSQATRTIDPLNPLVVNNTATDADLPPQILTYSLTSTVTGTNVPAINTNGIITWTPDVSQAGSSNVITTVVTDDGVPPLSATNSFSVIVNPVPSVGVITYSNGGYWLTWWAPTNDIFQVQVATNLASPTVWLTFSNFVNYTGPLTPTNGLFSFYDDGSQVPFGSLRFYRLQLVGVAPQATITVPIGTIVSTAGGFLLTWSAPTNDQFRVRWATNITPPIVWTLFPGTNTSITGVFSFMDTNAPLLMKFYDLILLP